LADVLDIRRLHWHLDRIANEYRPVGAHLNLDKSEPPAEYRVTDRSGFE
jgi:hypothetical protein